MSQSGTEFVVFSGGGSAHFTEHFGRFCGSETDVGQGFVGEHWVGPDRWDDDGESSGGAVLFGVGFVDVRVFLGVVVVGFLDEVLAGEGAFDVDDKDR